MSQILTVSCEEIIQPQLDDRLRLKILSDLFSEWLKRQFEQFEVEIDLNSNSDRSNLQPKLNGLDY